MFWVLPVYLPSGGSPECGDRQPLLQFARCMGLLTQFSQVMIEVLGCIVSHQNEDGIHDAKTKLETTEF